MSHRQKSEQEFPSFRGQFLREAYKNALAAGWSEHTAPPARFMPLSSSKLAGLVNCYSSKKALAKCDLLKTSLAHNGGRFFRRVEAGYGARQLRVAGCGPGHSASYRRYE